MALTIGSKVEFLGMCYKIVAIKGDEATIKPFRKMRNPRARKQLATIKLSTATEWKGR